MEFNNHTPEPPVGNYIESIFHYSGFMPAHSLERVVPTGHLYLIFELDGIQRNIFDNDTLKPLNKFKNGWISGQQTGCLTISAHEQSEMFVVQFKAFGAYPFLHIPLFELNDQIIPAGNILGKNIMEIRNAICSAETSAEKFKVMDKWLNSRFDDSKIPGKSFLKTVQKLQKEPVCKLTEVVDVYPKTQKHLIDQFKKYVGLTPKVYQRILRFNEIFQKINEEEKITWADVAYQCGYSDQSHFIKEFQHFSGLNPKEFITRQFNHDDSNFFPLDRDSQDSS